MRKGRSEDEFAQALRAKGLEVIPQVRVPRAPEETTGSFYAIDLALGLSRSRFKPAVTPSTTTPPLTGQRH